MTKKRRYTYQDDFEMLMVRHEYLSKVQDPDPNWVSHWEPIVKKTAMLMYNKLKPNFSKVGYEYEDVVSITNCFMVGYMGLYSLERNDKVRNRIFESYNQRYNRNPTPREITNKERTNLISFLRQRLQHASVICSRKARNITVGCDKRAIYAFTKDSVPASNELILEKGTKLGYRKVTKDELKSIKLNARVNRAKELTDKDGFSIVQIEILNDGITEYDYRGIFLTDRKDLYHNSPEDVLLTEDHDLSLMVAEFGAMDSNSKKSCLDQFITTFKGNKQYREEIDTARQMMKQL